MSLKDMNNLFEYKVGDKVSFTQEAMNTFTRKSKKPARTNGKIVSIEKDGCVRILWKGYKRSQLVHAYFIKHI